MNPKTIEAAALLLTLVVALRSTWSPCGLSMLSTLTPLGERSRGHRYPLTAGWFVLGAAAGGAALGGLCAGPAYLVGVWSPAPGSAAVVVSVAAVVTIAADLRLPGVRLPTVPRQVDENWTRRYRRWVYASGFGAQIGAGVVTYVMTTGVYLMLLLAVLSGRPGVALAVGVAFGVLRGLAVLLGAGLTTPGAIRRLHRRLDALAGVSLGLAVTAQLVVLGVAAGPVPGLVAAVVVAGIARWRLRARALHPSAAA